MQARRFLRKGNRTRSQCRSEGRESQRRCLSHDQPKNIQDNKMLKTKMRLVRPLQVWKVRPFVEGMRNLAEAGISLEHPNFTVRLAPSPLPASVVQRNEPFVRLAVKTFKRGTLSRAVERTKTTKRLRRIASEAFEAFELSGYDVEVRFINARFLQMDYGAARLDFAKTLSRLLEREAGRKARREELVQWKHGGDVDIARLFS